MKSASALGELLFLATPGHECSYLPERTANTVFADPGFPKDMRLYTALSQVGFRRSGAHIYRPHCQGCQACIAVRIPVAEFQARRIHRRVERANRDLKVIARKADFDRRHFDLYVRYLASRHRGGGMDNPTPHQYMDFLTSTWAETVFYEFSFASRLVAVAAVDRLLDGLSAVYTFFDPVFARRSPGAFSILWTIQEARRLGLPWLYLGYWVEDAPKMKYKRDYLPQEHFRDGQWIRVNRAHGDV